MTNRFLSFFETVGRKSETIVKDSAIVAADVAPLVPMMAPFSTPLHLVVAGLEHQPAQKLVETQNSLGELAAMNQLETFAITIILGIINTVIKNPAHKAAVQDQLLGIAADIQTAYGLVPPVMPSSTAVTTAATVGH